MILRRLRVRRFLGLADADFEFARGINVIVGPNEAGKSTVRAAIRTVLYGNAATTSAAKRDEFTSWGTEDPPELELEFELNERLYTVTKDFAKRTVVLADGTGRTWEQHKVVQESLAKAVGLATEELFAATAQVAHAELERIHVDSIARELGRLIGGGGEDVIVAIRKLDQRVRAMEKGSKSPVAVREPGVLRALDDRVGALRAESQRLTASVGEIERKRAALAETAPARKRLAEELGAKVELLALNRRILQDEERLRGLRSQEKMLEARVNNITENLHKLDQIDHTLEETTAHGVPEADVVRALRSLQSRHSGLESQAQRLHRTLQEPPPEVPSGMRTQRLMLAATGGLVAFAGLLLVLLDRSGVGTVLAVIGGVTALGGWSSLARLIDARRQFEIRLADRQAHLAALQGELAEVQAGLAEHLRQSGASSAKELEERFDRYQGLVRDRTHIGAFLEELRGGKSDEELTDQWKTVRRDGFALEEYLRSPGIVDKHLLTPLDVQTYESHVDRLTREVSQLEEREQRLLWELEQLAAAAEALPRVEEQLQEAEDARRAVRTRHAAYRAALDGLDEARRLAEVPLRTVVEGRASEYLRTLTGGRYARLQVEEGSLQIEVYSDEARAWVVAEEPSLSRGTVDLVYMSVRLALVDVLAGAKRPPLLFDDPFITFDAHRRAAVGDLLRGLSETYQVFLFTCSPDYATVADLLIDLPQQASSSPRVGEPVQVPVPSVGPLWDRLR